MLVANYERTSAGPSWMLFRAGPAVVGESDSARITFQESDDAGRWRTRSELGDFPAELGLRSFSKAGRVILPASYGLTAVESHPPGFDLTMAHSARLGQLATDSTVAAIGVTLAAGDTLTLSFTPTAAGGARGEDCFFIVSRPLTAGELSGKAPRREEPQAAAPVFALYQNQPNPLARSTTIRFILPAASRVRLEIYDLLGRRVRTLANASFPPGGHEVECDRRATAGFLVQSGLYFYSIEAGPHRAVKRMVVLP